MKEAVAEAVQGRKSKAGVNGLPSVKWGTALTVAYVVQKLS